MTQGPGSPWDRPGPYPPPPAYPPPYPSAPNQPPPYPPVGGPSAYPAVSVAPAPPGTGWRPERVEPVAGTAFGLLHFEVAPVRSGLAVGSLVVGIAAIGLALVVGCIGLAGAGDGWGGWVAGAFTLLSGSAGLAGLGLGYAALRQIRGPGVPGRIRFVGRGLAVSGLICAGVGLLLTGLALLAVLLVQVG
jgi:hypothetical protein